MAPPPRAGAAPWARRVVGWFFGFGYFVAGLYWIGYAFLVDAKTFGWLLPVAVAGLPAYLAFYTALGLFAARLIWVRGPQRVLALATMLTGAEWLRGHLLSGFPWNTFGYALTEPLVLAQSVSLTGIWGLTFLCIAICASPAVLADDATDTPRPHRTVLFGLLILAGLASYGTVRLWQNPTAYVSGVKLRIMQPNLQQDREIQLRRQGAGHGALYAPVRPHHGPQLERRARRHGSDLAGIVISVFLDARARCAGADHDFAQTLHRIDHRRGAPGAAPMPTPRTPIIRSM